MKKSERMSPEADRVMEDTAVCPTCGQPLGRELLDEVVRVPDLPVTTDGPAPPPVTADGPAPPPAAPRPDAPTDADVEWALSPPATAEKREFLRMATQEVAVEQDRFEGRVSELEAFEAMWPPRRSKERPGES